MTRSRKAHFASPRHPGPPPGRTPCLRRQVRRAGPPHPVRSPKSRPPSSRGIRPGPFSIDLPWPSMEGRLRRSPFRRWHKLDTRPACGPLPLGDQRSTPRLCSLSSWMLTSTGGAGPRGTKLQASLQSPQTPLSSCADPPVVPSIRTEQARACKRVPGLAGVGRPGNKLGEAHG